MNVIFASTEVGGIGYQNKLPWRLKQDLQRFQEITTTTRDHHYVNMLIMGRKTWESLPRKMRPLPNRINVIVSRNPSSDLLNQVKTLNEMCVYPIFVTQDLTSALNVPFEKDNDYLMIENIFVIGGKSLIEEALNSIYLRRVYHTLILQSFECDVFVSPIPYRSITEKLKSKMHLETQSEINRDEEQQIDYQFSVFVK